MNTTQIQINERDVVDLARAAGGLAAAQFNLEQTRRRVFEAHGIDPAKVVSFDGDVVTLREDSSDA